jgi:hypothetical protein
VAISADIGGDTRAEESRAPVERVGPAVTLPESENARPGLDIKVSGHKRRMLLSDPRHASSVRRDGPYTPQVEKLAE